jgi:hypothetical protein
MARSLTRICQAGCIKGFCGQSENSERIYARVRGAHCDQIVGVSFSVAPKPVAVDSDVSEWRADLFSDAVTAAVVEAIARNARITKQVSTNLIRWSDERTPSETRSLTGSAVPSSGTTQNQRWSGLGLVKRPTYLGQEPTGRPWDRPAPLTGAEQTQPGSVNFRCQDTNIFGVPRPKRPTPPPLQSCAVVLQNEGLPTRAQGLDVWKARCRSTFDRSRRLTSSMRTILRAVSRDSPLLLHPMGWTPEFHHSLGPQWHR